jgi:ABC-type multidrug transport system fused ATPase/permease subunit
VHFRRWLLRTDAVRTRTWAISVSVREALKRADQVIVMDEGRVVATGKAEELMKTSLVFREMWAED